MTVIIKRLGRGNWKPQSITVIGSGLVVGRRILFDGIAYRILEIHQ
jgi:hypothetical protein